MLAQTGEFLTFDNNLKLMLEPMLAASWSHNGDGSVWTFKLRPGVKFHNGAPMTADDVVYTFKQLSDPKNASNALSTFTGVLLPAGVRKVDAATVAFHLQAPNGNFPYLVSSDNYNAIIVPAGTDFGKWQKTFVGTGPFKLQSYTPERRRQLRRQPGLLGSEGRSSAAPSSSSIDSQSPQILALQGRRRRRRRPVRALRRRGDPHQPAVHDHQAQGIQPPRAVDAHRPGAVHRSSGQAGNRADASTARGWCQALLHGLGSVANDNPFAPKFASTDTTVPQRVQDLAKAKQLLAAAGHAERLHHHDGRRHLRGDHAARAGRSSKPRRRSASTSTSRSRARATYYGKATFGNSDWLDSTMSLVNYGDRGVPNVFLDAPLAAHGAWNAAHFNDPAYNTLFKQYTAAIDRADPAHAGRQDRAAAARRRRRSSSRTSSTV